MKNAPIPLNETQRIAAVRRYDLLDTPSEQEFDDLTRLASHICGTPIALMTVLDSSRQWFKSRVGLGAEETARNISFCGHAIEGPGLFEVPDALKDQRFFDNPLVTGEPDIRFYAGAPLISPDGYRLGTLCVIDRVPRELNRDQRDALLALGRQVSRQIEYRAVARRMAEESRFQAAVFDSSHIALLTTDASGLITAFNRGAENLLGYRAVDVIGTVDAMRFFDPQEIEQQVVQMARPPPTEASTAGALLEQLSNSKRVMAEWNLRTSNGEDLAAEVAISPLRDARGMAIGWLMVMHDLREKIAAAQRQRQSQDFIRKIAERVPGLIYQCRLSPDGSSSFPYASEGIRTIYRLAPEAVKDDASAVLALIAPDDRARYAASLHQSAQELVPWSEEYRVCHADGSVRWLSGNAVPQREADGSVLWHGFISDVTESKLIDVALRKNERFLQTLIDLLPVGVYSKSMRANTFGQMVLWNKAAETISGYRRVEVIGKTNAEIFPAKMARYFDAHDAAILARPVMLENTAQNYSRDGIEKILHTTSVPLFDDDGNLEYVFGISEDISAATAQSGQLKSQQAELLAINDSCPVGMVRTDANGVCTYVNRKFLAITGMTFAQSMGAGWLAAVHPEDRANIAAMRAESDEPGEGHGSTLRFVRQDGVAVLCHVLGEPILVDGSFKGFITTVDDITERKRIHDALRESEARLRLITDNLPALISFIDADRRYRFANKAYHELLGIDPQTMIGRSVEAVHGAEAYTLMAPEIEAAANGYRVSFERIIGTREMPLYLQCDYLPAFDTERRPIGFYAMAVDVTSRRIAEKKLRDSEARLSAITNHIPALVAHIDSTQRYLFVNAQIGATFHKKPEDMIGRTMQQEHPPALYATLKPFIERVLAGEVVTFEGKTIVNGQLAHYQSTYVPDRDERQRVRGFYAMTLDISDSKNNEIRQQAAEKRLRTIADNLPVLITYIDHAGRFQFANATIESWIGVTPAEVYQRLFEDVMGPTIYADRKVFMERALAGERVEFELQSSMAGIDRFLHSVYIPDRAPDGFVRGFYTVTSDISRLKESEAKLMQLARFDSLTSLPNRHQLNEKLAEAVARSHRTKSNVAVLYLDIDHFKQINDTHGHAAGDAVLVQFSQRLSACVRSTDTVARLSGDEFVIVLEGLQSVSESGLIAQKIVAAMVAPWPVNGVLTHVTCSIGIAYAHTFNMTADDLLALADKSLYRAKHSGRNTFMVTEQDPESPAMP